MLSPQWSLLDPGDDDRYWRRFRSTFRFRAGTNPDLWPAIEEPTPSLTFDLGLIFGREPAGFAAGAAAVNADVRRAMASHLTGPLIVLDWQHPSYRFDPRSDGGQQDRLDDWPVTPFPDGDYFAFLTEDFAAGTFGHPWEQSLCVIGAALVGTLGEALRAWLPVLRIDGRPAGASDERD